MSLRALRLRRCAGGEPGAPGLGAHGRRRVPSARCRCPGVGGGARVGTGARYGSGRGVPQGCVPGRVPERGGRLRGAAGHPLSSPALPRSGILSSCFFSSSVLTAGQIHDPPDNLISCSSLPAFAPSSPPHPGSHLFRLCVRDPSDWPTPGGVEVEAGDDPRSSFNLTRPGRPEFGRSPPPPRCWQP